MAKKKQMTKKEWEKRFDAWRDCGKTYAEARLLVVTGKQAPLLEDRQQVDQGIS